MLKSGYSYLNFAEPSYQSFPVLALERFLRSEAWKGGLLPHDIVVTIIKALKFLNAAFKGKKMIQEAAQKKRIPLDYSSVRAYNLVIDAFQNSGLDDYSVEEVLSTTTELLQEIISSEDPSEIKISDEKKDMVMIFISKLGKTLITD